MIAEPFNYALLVLAAYGATFLITQTSGPFAVFALLRERLKLGGLWACFYCTVVWMAAGLLVLFSTQGWIVIYWLAIIGGASWLHRRSG